MNRAVWGVGLLWIFGMSLVLPSYARADETIGVAPASIQVKLFTQGTREERVNISRSGTEGDMTFRVESNEIPIITLPEDSRLTIPHGEQSADFFIVLDAGDALPGTYDGMLIFTLLPQEEDALLVNGTTVEFALKVGVHITVLDRPDASIALTLYDFPMLVQEITAADLDVSQRPGADGRLITTTWNLVNTGNNPIDGVTSSMRITRKDDLFYDDQYISASTIPAQGTLAQSVFYLLPNRYPSGRYVAHITVDGREITKTFWVIKPALWWCFGGLVGSVMIAGWLAFIMPHRRSRATKY